jgi:hypothetical protein
MTGQTPGGRPGPAPRSGLQPTRPGPLIVAGVVAGVLAYLGVRTYFGNLPDVTWLAGLTLAGLAVVEVVAAVNTKARIERRPGAGVLNPLLVARLVVLAKASSLAGAIFAGVYAGVAVWAFVERDQLTVAEHNLPPAIGGVVGASALLAAALLLEHACRVPEPPEDQDEQSQGTSGPRR